jgi:hypothetical protein
MVESLLSINSEIILIFGVGALLVTLGFMFGSLMVSEIALAFALAHLVLQFAPLSAMPALVAKVVEIVPFLPGEAVLFALLVGFGWWVSRSTVMIVDTVPRFSKIIPAAMGALGIIFLSVSHTVSLGSVYAPGPIATEIFSNPIEALLFVIACLSLVGISRKS